LQAPDVDFFNRRGRKYPGGSQVRQSQFDVLSRGILREDGTKDHFELCLPGPPMLRAKRGKE
jgi:hypothetical protein